MNTARERRLAFIAVALTATALLAGCATPPALWPFGGSAEDRAIRKQAEADPFPSAKQVGLQRKDAS